LLSAATEGALARSIAHDLNNLFTCILACATHPDEDAAGQRRSLSLISQAVERGAGLLALMRALEPAGGEARVEVGEMVMSCAGLLRRVGESAGVVVESSSDATLAAIAPFELQQILINLGLNAIDAMPGGGRLELRADALGDTVRLTATDTGVGIAADAIERVFDPCTSTKHGHRGIGLTVVQRVVTRRGGTVSVASAPGAGARFCVMLPVVAEGVE